MKYICALLLALLIMVPMATHAQYITPDLSLEIIPLNPEPGQTVTITATSYSIDLSQATLTWVYNGVQVAKAPGKTSIGVVAPKAGATGVVSVSAQAVGSTGASASVVLRPASLDLLWEAADAYTHPFYKGKALLAPNGLIRFTAIPSPSAPKSLSYTWSRNGSALPDDSGYNKSSVVFAHNEFNPQESVDVQTSGGVYTGTGTLRVTPTDPTVLAYQSKRGFIDYATGYSNTIRFTQNGLVLHFEPFFFSVGQSVLANLGFTLSLNGEPVSTTTPNEIGLSRPNTVGQSKLSVYVSPFAQSLQHIEKTFTLLFN